MLWTLYKGKCSDCKTQSLFLYKIFIQKIKFKKGRYILCARLTEED
jgi:hypothetical protein